MSFPHEQLTSQFDDGRWHARYPTGLLTLCGLPAHPQIGRKWPPSCPECEAAAQAWHSIDGAAPKHWRYKRRAQIAA